MIYPYTASVFDSDAYGVDTDNPESAYEIIDNELRAKDEIAIMCEVREFIKDMASEYFNTYKWDDEWWDAWHDKVRELV